MDTKILQKLEEAFAEELTLAGNNLGSLEMLVKEKMQLLKVSAPPDATAVLW